MTEGKKTDATGVTNRLDTPAIQPVTGHAVFALRSVIQRKLIYRWQIQAKYQSIETKLNQPMRKTPSAKTPK
jgi:hypothetical protein